MMKTPTKIKIEMLKKGVTGAQIARSLRCDRTNIYHVIEGRSRSLRVREAIARALGLRVTDLWPRQERKKSA